MTSSSIPLVTLKDLEGCWICRFRKKQCQVKDMEDRSQPCFDCNKFNIRCRGRGLPRPAGKAFQLKEITAMTRPWIRNSGGRNLLGAPLDPFLGVPEQLEAPEQALESLEFLESSCDYMTPLDTAKDDDSMNIPKNSVVDVNVITSQPSPINNNLLEAGSTTPMAAFASGSATVIPKHFWNGCRVVSDNKPATYFPKDQNEGSPATSESIHMPQTTGSLDQGSISTSLEQSFVGQTQQDFDALDNDPAWNNYSSPSAFWEKDYWS